MKTKYYTTNSVKVLLTQEQCKDLLFMCKSISSMCEDYMSYCWKQLLKDKKIDRNGYYHNSLKGYCQEAKYDKKNPYYYARMRILNNYFSRVEKVAKHAFEKKRNIDVSQLLDKCKSVTRLIGKEKSYLTLPTPTDHLTISKVNKQGTISINGIGKKIPLEYCFKESISGNDNITWMIFTITHRKKSLISVKLTLVCNIHTNSYLDKEGFYQLVEKGIKHG